MMKTTQTGTGYHGRFRTRLLFDWSPIGSIFVEGIVNAVLLIVDDVITDEAPQMSFIQRDDVVQQLTPTTANPTASGALHEPSEHPRWDSLRLGGE